MNKKIQALHLDVGGTLELGRRPAKRNDEYICEIVEFMENGQMDGIPVYLVYLKTDPSADDRLWQKIPSGMCRVEYTYCAESLFAIEEKNTLPF